MNHQNATIAPRLTNPLLPIVSSSLRLSPETLTRSDPAPPATLHPGASLSESILAEHASS